MFVIGGVYIELGLLEGMIGRVIPVPVISFLPVPVCSGFVRLNPVKIVWKTILINN